MQENLGSTSLRDTQDTLRAIFEGVEKGSSSSIRRIIASSMRIQ
ncbi:MAG: hypothetical protein WAM79_13730 [Candidatus Sulfotelmatobacter sp.]